MSTHELVSIPASHYCERARWALDYADISYEEYKWCPLLHYMGTLPTSGTKTVPVLKCPPTAGQRSKVLTDSADIVRYAHEHMLASSAASLPNGADIPPPSPLYPSDPEELRQVQRLEEMFSRKLGVWTRVVAYHHLFADTDAALDVLAFRQARPGSPGLARWKGAAMRAAYPVVRGVIRRGFGVSEAGAAACLARVEALFEEVGGMLARDGRGYLVGGRFTAADLTFASMAAVVLLPPSYGAFLPPPLLETPPPSPPGQPPPVAAAAAAAASDGAAHSEAAGQAGQAGPGARGSGQGGGPGGTDGVGVGIGADHTATALRLRATAAGRHAMRMYELHRGPRGTPGVALSWHRTVAAAAAAVGGEADGGAAGQGQERAVAAASRR